MTKINLLFLEDEEMDIFLIKKVLERAGISFDMVTVATKDDFIKAITTERFDAILADNTLPQFNALEAIEIIEEREMSIPLILVTGTVTEDFAVQAMKKGAWDYILKDRLQRLPAAINSAIDRHRTIQVQKDAEQKLKESEQKYRYLFENNPMPIMILDIATLTFLDVNKAAVSHYGYSYEEFVGMSALWLRPEDERDRFKNMNRKPDMGYTNNGRWQHMKKDGSIIQVEICADDITYDGKHARLVLVNDVTDKVTAEENLKKSELRLKAAQRIAHIGAWKVDIGEGKKNINHWWSDETYRIFGFQPGEIAITDELYFSMIHPDDRLKLSDAMAEIKYNLAERIVEHRIIRKDGEIRTLELIGEIICSQQGVPVAMEGTLQDITERKTTENQIRQSEANLRSIFNTTNTGYALLDVDLNVVSFSEPVNNFAKSQLKKEITIGTNALLYFNDERQPTVKECLLNALEGQTSSYEIKYPQADRGDKWYFCSYCPVPDRDKKTLGVLMAITDITERKQLEIQEKVISNDLIQRNNDLEQFAYIISHNLRAPVANIIGISNALTEGNLDEADTHEFLEGLKTSIHKLDAVIVDLNNIIQVKHKINQHREMVNLNQIVNDIKFSLSNFSDNDIVMIITDFDEVNELSTLRSYIYSIFYNLISNSIKYKRSGIAPVIEIKSRKTENKIEITFRDNSMGIDMEKKGDQIFGLYKRFHQQAAEGKGIGLFMVKTQVETLGGRISVRSQVNHGTEFKIEFEMTNFMN